MHTVLITGAAGYVGAMLVRAFAAREDVATVVGLDKEPLPKILSNEPKLVYLQMNTVDEWEEEVKKHSPDIVIHAAWHIREIYGNRKRTYAWNIEGSEKVFAFAFREPSVKRLVHFSTIASYGAFADNSLQHRYTEEEPFRESAYLYAEEKRIAEERLETLYKENARKDMSVSVVRPAAITGPCGRFLRIRLGLQSTLAGQMKGSWIYSIISAMVLLVPVTPKWLRQFVHEDDVVAIVERLSFGETAGSYEVFNLCPPGDPIRGKDMAKVVGKWMLPVHPRMVQLGYFAAWHLTQGKVPTAPGAWRSYSYPIAVDGSKVTRALGYEYRYTVFDALYYTDGTYEGQVPVELRRTKAS